MGPATAAAGAAAPGLQSVDNGEQHRRGSYTAKLSDRLRQAKPLTGLPVSPTLDVALSESCGLRLFHPTTTVRTLFLSCLVGVHLMRPTFVWLALCALGCLATSASAQQPANNPIPPAAAEVLTRMDKEIVIAKTKAVTSLEKILRDTTKKGDLAGALAVKQAIDRLNGDVKAGARAGGGGGSIVGRWRGDGFTIEYFPDGTLRHSDGSRGTWIDNGGVVEARLNNGWAHIMEPQGDGYFGVTQKGENKAPLRYVRDNAGP